jgi:hypothetical protein
MAPAKTADLAGLVQQLEDANQRWHAAARQAAHADVRQELARINGETTRLLAAIVAAPAPADSTAAVRLKMRAFMARTDDVGPQVDFCCGEDDAALAQLLRQVAWWLGARS